MSSLRERYRRIFALIFALGAASATFAQRPTPTPDDTIRIDSALIQTAVTVTDKNGRFVDGLKQNDISLKVGGKPTVVAFFEEISAGAALERKLRPGTGDTAESRPPAMGPDGRTIIFFLDDLHLSPNSIKRTRDMLNDFVDNKMREGDVVAIATAKGTIGFLQQFTENRDVLRAAISRIVHVPYRVTDPEGMGAAPMPEYYALSVERRDDPSLIEFYVQDCMRRAAGGPNTGYAVKKRCEVQVDNRARQIVLQASVATQETYSAFEGLLTTAGRMAGSKLAFFVSDGFLADSGPRGRISQDRVNDLTEKARRAGVVIYSIDASGLVSGALDATNQTPMDPNGRLEAAAMRAIPAAQDGMNALAVDTGGKALRDQNYFDNFVTDAIRETARYYLIAWMPAGDNAAEESSKKIEISLPGRPDLTVRARKGFRRAFDTSGRAADPRVQKSKDQIKEALTDSLSSGEIPVDLSAVYMDVPGNGLVLTTSVQIPARSLSFGPMGNEPASVSVAGVVLDDHGKPAASFGTGLTVDPPKGTHTSSTDVIYNHPSPLKPGIYQVRAAARDDKSKVYGSSSQWVIVPDLTRKDLAVSSLLLGLESVAVGATVRSQWSIDHRFPRGKKMRFMGFVYNAARDASGKTDLSAEVHVRRRGVDQTPPNKKRVILDPSADTSRVPVGEELDLRALTPGRYTLEMTIEDHLAHKRAVQTASFIIE